MENVMTGEFLDKELYNSVEQCPEKTIGIRQEEIGRKSIKGDKAL